MQGNFVILRNNKLETYNNYKAIPKSFTNLIKFEPVYPLGPHTDEQHEEMEKYSEYLTELLGRENASSN